MRTACNSTGFNAPNQDEEFNLGESNFLAVTLLNYATPYSKFRAPAPARGSALTAVERHAHARECENRTG